MIQVGPLIPSYITIDPTTGQVSADFTGHVHAGGLDLDQDNNPPTRSDRRIRWLRLANGSVTADIEAFDAGTSNPVGNIATFRSYDQNGVIVGIQLESSNIHRILAQAGGLGITVFDDGGKSNFAQLDAAAKWGFHGVYTADSGILAASGNESQITVNHNLGKQPAVVFGALQDGSFATEVGWRWGNIDNNNVQITFHSLGPNANVHAILQFLALTTT